MIEVSSAEFQKNFGRWQDAALTRPLTVTRNGRPRLVVLSVEEYERMLSGARIALKAEDFPPDLAEAITAARMDPRHEALNAELDR